MKKILTIAVLAGLFALALFAASALAGATDKPPSPPGQGECEHGNSGKPCRDDPQPEHGKDCDEHGPKNGGVNEDHCKGETEPPVTTTEPPVTTTEPPVTTTEEPKCSDCPMPTVPEPTPPTTVPSTQPPASAPGPPVSAPPVSKPTLEEELEEQAAANGAPTTPTSADVQSTPDALPYTGFPLWAIALIGAGLAGTGVALRRRSG